MTIEIELTQEEDARLRERAARAGFAPEQLAAVLLRTQLQLPPPPQSATGFPVSFPPVVPVVDEQGDFSEERWREVERRLAQVSLGLPPLPAQALTREALYQDHD